ncbi:MAG: glycosyltransferase family 4 protein [Ferruginibacter sp.]|nr:glycosyltransferase family 4 protein [Ferruginibacter sp.]
MHESPAEDGADYLLNSPNILFVSLGLKTPAWHRMIFYRKILKGKLHVLTNIDFFIVRSPSPLSPFINKFVPAKKIVYMIVGDYLDGARQIKFNSIRSSMIILLLRINDSLFRAQMKKSLVLVNSPALFEKYQKLSKFIGLIKTTTLSTKDFFYREDTCASSEIRLLFTGRFDPAKGLFELVQSIKELSISGKTFQLDFVGWETDKAEPVKAELQKLGKHLGLQQFLHFHPKMSVGEELNAMYRKADIYLIPSYHEGFPRTIWEAMANSCPVIATSVGSIPFVLTDKEQAILIQPKNVNEIVDAIKLVVEDTNLRRKIIQNGFVLAQSNTLETQTAHLLTNIYSIGEN